MAVVNPQALTILNGPTIRAGQSLSDGIDCSGGRIVKLTMPSTGWNPANMTFQFSSDGNGYNDMYDMHGDEITLPEIPPGAGFVLDRDWLGSIVFLKIRSGTTENPVVQDADRQFAIAVDMSA